MLVSFVFSVNQKAFVICTRDRSLHSCYTFCTRVAEKLHSFLSQSELSNFFVYIISVQIKSSQILNALSFMQVEFARKKVLPSPIFFKKIAPNTQVESSTTPLFTIDEVEKVQRQRIASFIGHAFQLTYAALIDKLIQQEKLNRFNGCSKRQLNTPFLALLFLHVRGKATRFTLAMSNNLTA